jgi:N-acetylglucosaminyldiphosphoundecaprenol N-acetyl-beta-D-mannosaminyltransferase
MTLTVDFLGTRIDCFTPEAAVEELASRIREHQKTRVYFVNANCLNIARGDETYRDCLKRGELVLPDGSGVLLACRLLGIPIRHNLNGTDLVPKLLARAAVERRTVFLLGGRPGVAAAAAIRLAERMPDLRVVGHANGYLRPDQEQMLIRQISELEPDILLVGKGVPVQELWLDRNWEQLNVGVGLAVGALLDFVAGIFPRAPRWMRASGIEWCWRLAHEPRRLGRRYLIGNATFLIDVARSRFSRTREQTAP